MIFLRPRLALVLLASLTLAACSHEGSAKTPDPASLLQAIPGADSAKYEHMQDMRNWRNPYFIVRADTIVLLDAADNAEIHLKPEEVLPALAQLPAANWPYGRVVAVAENSARGSEQDGTAIRRNKGVLGGVLAGAHIDVRWVPVT